MTRTNLAALAALALPAALVLPAAQAAHAATTVTPVHDAYVNESRPDSNFGARAVLRVDGSPVVTSYLRFDVAATDPTSAVLVLRAEAGSSAGFDVATVADTSWTETEITANNAPPVGAVLDSTGPFSTGDVLRLDVSAGVTGAGPVSFALLSSHRTATKVSSSEGATPPRLEVTDGSGEAPGGDPADSTTFTVSGSGSSYTAESGSTSYTGSLKSVVERAVEDLRGSAGTIRFESGTFDLGSDYFKLTNVEDLVFEGAGMTATTIQNSSSASADTEPFNVSGAWDVTVRDLTVRAGGPARNTSDALDFDQGNRVTLERVRVTQSRGRGIVFDGKNDDWDSVQNTVRDCVIDGVNSDGIELLASTDNTIEGCTITDVGGHGIQLAKSSSGADQPNKLSSANLLRNNTIDQAGKDGVNMNGGNDNVLQGNTITNSSDDTSGRSGIRLGSSDGVDCDRNWFHGNTATDTQSTKTQRYGLYISSSLCDANVVGPGNDFSGNREAAIRDEGSGTVYQ